MIRKEFAISTMDKPCGGKGRATLYNWLTEDELMPNVNMICTISIPVGGSIGNHIHMDESELCFLQKGQGSYNDNGRKVEVAAGDILVCYNGQCHGLINTGQSELEFIGIVVRG